MLTLDSRETSALGNLVNPLCRMVWPKRVSTTATKFKFHPAIPPLSLYLARLLFPLDAGNSISYALLYIHPVNLYHRESLRSHWQLGKDNCEKLYPHCHGKILSLDTRIYEYGKRVAIDARQLNIEIYKSAIIRAN